LECGVKATSSNVFTVVVIRGGANTFMRCSIRSGNSAQHRAHRANKLYIARPPRWAGKPLLEG
jgi:hypothetical protein